jgi:2'-5' RNA ligase
VSDARVRRRADQGRCRPVGPELHRPEHPRLFVAVPLPAPARDEIAALAGRVRAAADGVRARWVAFEGLHLTLRFLGPTPPEALPDLRAALASAAAQLHPFEIALAGGGAFPSTARPRALWVGVMDGSDRLASLAEILASDPRVARNLPEDRDAGGRRPFSPHLTLARTDGVRDAALLARALRAEAAGFEVRFRAETVVLYRSRLGSGPARYEAVHEARLGG